jgi:hypothetical protein
MAKQETMIKLTGSVGNITFYQHKNGKFFARQKPHFPKEKFLTGPEFAESRKASAEFGQAARISGIVRKALHPVLQDIEGFGHSKLTALFRAVIQSDLSHEKGEREFAQGDASLYESQELGKHALKQQIGGLPILSSEADSRLVHLDFRHLYKKIHLPTQVAADLYGVQLFGIEILDNGNGGSRTVSVPLPHFSLETVPSVLGTQVLDFEAPAPQNAVRIAAVSLRFYTSIGGALLPYKDVGGVCLLGRV